MATAEAIRSENRVQTERSGSRSDDVLSLDSWSEKLDSISQYDWPADSVNENSRPRIPSAGRMAHNQHRAVAHHRLSDIQAENMLPLRSGQPVSSTQPSVNYRSRTETIPSISGNVYSRENVFSKRRSGSSASSDSDSSPLHSPRLKSEPTPQSPSMRIPSIGTHHVHGGHHFHFAQHLHPHYQSSPVHRNSAGHLPSHGITRPMSSHHPVGSFPPHGHSPSHKHHGLSYYSHAYPGHQAGFHAANNGAFDQFFEREGEKIKTKMKSVWNNVKYGWTIKTKTSFKFDSPIFLLGRCYHRRADEMESPELNQFGAPPPQQLYQHLHQQQPPYKVSALDEFHADFTSRLWFTYRREFAPIGSAKMTTDCGWGCMLRSGQMMVAQGLVQHFLGRDWRVYSEQLPQDLAFYREIVRWFGDHPSDKAPFSLHRLVDLGTSVGKMPGDWYGPASVAHIFRDALEKAHASLPILSDISAYVAQDCTIYLQDLWKILLRPSRSHSQLSASSDSDSHSVPPPSYSTLPPSASRSQQDAGAGEENGGEEGAVRSVLILVPMRLGGETLNDIYIPCVKSMLAHDTCIGIIGGRPKHSLYFVGWQDDKLIHLDPHYCQDTVDTSQAHFPIQSFHCMSPRKMAFSKMDPSCTVGFYCRNKAQLMTFIQQVPDLVVPPGQRGQYPLFVVSEGSSDDQFTHQPPARELGRLRIRHMRTDRAGNRIRSPTLDSEDFVIL